MKKELAAKYKFIAGFAWVVITFWGCTNDINDLGKSLLLPGDLVHIGQVTEKATIKAYTVTDEKQRTDEPAFNLLGTYNDSIFGKTTADFAFQLRLNSYPDFSNSAQPDSLVLYLHYKEVYGDIVTAQRLKVYELASDLVLDNKYDQDVNLRGLSQSSAMVIKSFVPKFKLDSLSSKYGSTKALPKDTVIQQIAIKLDPKLAKRLMAADSLTMSDNDKFLQYFKGLYIQAEDLALGGSIVKIDYSIPSVFSGLVMYYHNNSTDSLYYRYSININSARVGRFSHDYSTTTFAANLDKQDVQDSLIYLQTTGGLRTKILIPNLGNWSDSTNFAINQAELIFQVDSTVSDLTRFLPPNQLVLTALDKDGKEYLPSDVAFSSVYYGGTYHSADKTYRFNIAKHMQEVIEKKKENYGFFLSSAFRSAIYRRVVLKGATSKTGIRLNITYSKIK
ncbi:MAG: DUF4270 family protein [Bacteroidota bacterium]|nr:DUF4270 family protein [Bacteroidota bacterium]